MAASANLLTQTIQAPWGGYDTMTPDNQLPVNKCRRLENWMPGRNGRIYLRGPVRRPITSDVTFPAGGATTWSGGWVFNDKILISDMRTATAGFMVTDWSGASPSIAAKVNPAGLNVGLYPFHARAGNFVYGYTAGTAGAPFTTVSPNRRTSNGSATAADARLMYWNGGALVGDFVLYAANHPRGAVDVKSFLNRLWILGGSDPGTTTPVFTTRLYYSVDLGNGTTVMPDNVTSWQTGGVNNVIALEGSSNDYGVALAFLNGRMIILRRQSTYMLTGTSPSNFQIRKVAGVGCIDPGSVIEWDDGIFFLSDTGYMFFDGASVRNVSTPITDTFMTAFQQGTEAAEMSVARLGSEHIFMTSTSAFPSHIVPRAWIYHVPTQAWTEFLADTNVFNRPNGYPLRVTRVTNYPLVYDGTTVYDATYVTIPENIDPDNAGQDRTLGGTTKYNIPALMYSRWLRLASPGREAHISRVYHEYIATSIPNPILVPGIEVAFFKKVRDPNTILGGGPYGLPGVSGGLGFINRTHPDRITTYIRYDRDAVEVQLRVQVVGGGSSGFMMYCEVYDTVVYFTPTSDLVV